MAKFDFDAPDCACGYKAGNKVRSGSGHAAECPVHQRWLALHMDEKPSKDDDQKPDPPAQKKGGPVTWADVLEFLGELPGAEGKKPVEVVLPDGKKSRVKSIDKARAELRCAPVELEASDQKPVITVVGEGRMLEIDFGEHGKVFMARGQAMGFAANLRSKAMGM